MDLLQVTGLRKSFGPLAVLSGVDLAVGAGEIVGVAGPNGAGKSTLVNLVSGLVRPDGGRVFFAGRDVTRTAVQSRVRLGIARTFQIPRPLAGLTVRAQVLLAAAATAVSVRPAHRSRTLALLERLELWEQRDLWPENLSSGALRRLEVARALACGPRLLLLDEPFAGLSPREEPLVLSVIREAADQGTAVVLVSHRPRLLHLLARRVHLFQPRSRPGEQAGNRWA